MTRLVPPMFLPRRRLIRRPSCPLPHLIVLLGKSSLSPRHHHATEYSKKASHHV